MSSHVLVATLGSTPQVVVQTIYGLFRGAMPRRDWPEDVLPTELHLIATTKLTPDVDTVIQQVVLLIRYLERHGTAEARIPQMRVWYISEDGTLPSHSLAQVVHSTETEIQVFGQSSGLPDIVTDEHNACASNFTTALIARLTDSPNAVVHASITGGRKSMSAYLAVAMSMLKRTHDSASHVLSHEGNELDLSFVNNLLENKQESPDKDVAGNRLFEVARLQLAPVSSLVRLEKVRPLLTDPGQWEPEAPPVPQLERTIRYIECESQLMAAQKAPGVIQTPLRLKIRWPVQNEAGGWNPKVSLCGRLIGLKPSAYCLLALAVWWWKESNHSPLPITTGQISPPQDRYRSIAISMLAGLIDLDEKGCLSRQAKSPLFAVTQKLFELSGGTKAKDARGSARNKFIAFGLCPEDNKSKIFSAITEDGLVAFGDQMKDYSVQSTLDTELLLPNIEVIPRAKDKRGWVLAGRGSTEWELEIEGSPPFDPGVAVEKVSSWLRNKALAPEHVWNTLCGVKHEKTTTDSSPRRPSRRTNIAK